MPIPYKVNVQKMFDYVLLGSSLVNLIEAIHLSSIGKSVCVVDKSPNVGGAWELKDYFDINNMEVGCHIFASLGDEKKDNAVYSFLEKFFDINMIEMDPRPLNIVNHYLSVEMLKTVKHYYPEGGVASFFHSLHVNRHWEMITFLSGGVVKAIDIENDV